MHVLSPVPSLVIPGISSSEQTVRDLAALADIRIGGNRPWDIRVNDPRLYSRVLSHGTLGLGESYMDGWWDCVRLDEFFFRAMRSGLHKKISFNFPLVVEALKSKMLNLQTKRGARTVAEEHYNLGNNLFRAFLDPWMQYSCGYFRGTDDLNEAQERKLNLIAQKLQITSSDRVLDIGCGWGGLARFLAERFGCHVTGVNISQEQILFAQEWCRGFPVEIVDADYRDIRGSFTKIVSVGMFEHVGPKNYRTFMDVVYRCLDDEGLFLLHTIGQNAGAAPDPWLEHYIFPHSVLPCAAQIMSEVEDGFVMEDWHNFGADYDRTLLAWHRNFRANWPLIQSAHDERFRRMWEYYLLSCAAAFRARWTQLWQIVLSKNGLVGGYRSVR